MPLFGIPEATYYCSAYSNSVGAAQGSFRALGGTLAVGRTFSEGSADFTELRDCSLREVERLLFLGIGQYRTSFNLFTPSTAGWANTTLYYASYFAANSLLGMFGSWKLHKNRVIDAARSAVGNQQLVVRKVASTYGGSHRQFWEFFYTTSSPLLAWIDPSLRYAMLPVSGSVTWLIDSRNDANYDTHIAIGAARLFQSTFRRSKFPSGLPGALGTQFAVADGLLRIAVLFARQFKLKTDALDLLLPSGSRADKLRELIFDHPTPQLQRYIKRRAFIG